MCNKSLLCTTQCKPWEKNSSQIERKLRVAFKMGFVRRHLIKCPLFFLHFSGGFLKLIHVYMFRIKSASLIFQTLREVERSFSWGFTATSQMFRPQRLVLCVLHFLTAFGPLHISLACTWLELSRPTWDTCTITDLACSPGVCFVHLLTSLPLSLKSINSHFAANAIFLRWKCMH